MATERQIAANRRNSTRSTGPNTEAGKARSCLNALKHGLAAEDLDIESQVSPEFEARRDAWSGEFHPVGPSANWALDRAVTASFRIERCEHAINELVDVTRTRAELLWDEDQDLEAAAIAARLGQDPVLNVRKMETNRAGVDLLIEMWEGLVEALNNPSGWLPAEVAMALNMLGVSLDLRNGRTPVDPPEGSDLVDFRRELGLKQIERLKEVRDEALIAMDDLARRQAIKGNVALLSKPAKLLLRYERDAWKRYHQSIKEIRDSGQDAEPAETPVPPVSTLAPQARPVSLAFDRRVEPPPMPDFEGEAEFVSLEESEALLAEAGQMMAETAAMYRSHGLEEKADWLEAVQRQCGRSNAERDGTKPISAAMVG